MLPTKAPDISVHSKVCFFVSGKRLSRYGPKRQVSEAGNVFGGYLLLYRSTGPISIKAGPIDSHQRVEIFGVFHLS